ncbi:hypothetical protein S100390_v1c07730 [Spiroplasma sp. NBRC 100390]|uniref:hypothetical protein n=1 Tax=unclassified Spiroplasma TaxID=2637901 RepID=UPI0008929350|nr:MULTISPECIES: hypothetical protein [unclassified Spiroplasma]AOX44109.1 hypothetical protein STU14_v1c07730 [Spiroplasma sp. TU-14]APE13579.1 hypothetical protein S100390_v1c07730 [Spiroplasma sp. NBRC 100390]
MKFDLAKIKKMKNLKDLEIYLFKTYLPKNGNRIIKAELLNLIHTYFPTVTSEQANQFITLLKDNRVVFLRGYGYVGNETLESFGCRQQDAEENEQAKVLDPPAACQKKIPSAKQKEKPKMELKPKTILTRKTIDVSSLSFPDRYRNFMQVLYPIKNEKEKPKIALADIPDLAFNNLNSSEKYAKEGWKNVTVNDDENYIDPTKRNIILKDESDEVMVEETNEFPEPVKTEKIAFDLSNPTSSEAIWRKMSISQYRKYFLSYHQITQFQYQGLNKFFIDYLLALPINDKLITNYYEMAITNKKIYAAFYDNYLRNRIKYAFLIDYNLFYDIPLIQKNLNKYHKEVKKAAENIIINLFMQFLTLTFNVNEKKLEISPDVIDQIKTFYWTFNQKMHLFEFKDYIFSTNPKWKEEYAINFINFFEGYKFTSNQQAINLIIDHLESAKLLELLKENINKINFRKTTINDHVLWYDVKTSCHLLDNELTYIKGNLLNNIQTIFEETND